MLSSLAVIVWLGILTFTFATPGCGKSHHSGYNNNVQSHSINSGGRQRTYAVQVPEGYNQDENKPRPLIVDFHGNKGSPDGQHDNSRYYNYEQGKQYLVVYPAGVKGHWQGPSYAIKGVNDLQFVTDLVEHIKNQYCVDTKRIYASGKSNGGGFVDTLACSSHGNQFAAFAMAAAALYTDAHPSDVCPFKRAIIEAHGTSDQTIPYSGTDSASGGATPNLLEWFSRWGSRNGCGPKKTSDRQGHTLHSFSCNGHDDVLVHYQIHGEGHCWPSKSTDTTDGRRSYCTHQLDFTPIALDFFSRWTIDNTPKNGDDKFELDTKTEDELYDDLLSLLESE